MTPQDIVVTSRAARFLGRSFPVALGRGGIVPPGAKREAHRIVGCLWRADRLAQPCNWAVPIGPSDLWSDDVNDADYNHLVRAPHLFSAERLARPDPLYDVVLTTDWNWPRAEKGRGSAIFVHSWRAPRHPTAGCVALRRDHLLWIVERIAPGGRLIVRG
jgi:hypothetical protein